MEQFEQVSNFMGISGQDRPETPIIPSDAIKILRHELIMEENNELLYAKDLVEAADALCDSLYVVLGAFAAYGFKSALITELFDEVHRSNMSKFCTTLEEAAVTQADYYSSGISVIVEKHKEYWIIMRASDRKVLKSINYSAPDLKSILKKYGYI